ncbi:MAG: tail fiber protein [Deltaproteobacteria bacterium]|nr:tail fiber protein [Deltaproteobacteria bacterium]
MKQLKLVLFGLGAVAATFAVGRLVRAGDIPSILPYEGYLTGPDGASIADGAMPMTFRFFATPTATDEECEWNVGMVAVRGGRFRVAIGDAATGNGDCTAIQALIADHGALWLEITITMGGAPEKLSPRIPLRATAQAHHAQVAEVARAAGGGLATTVQTLLADVAALKAFRQTAESQIAVLLTEKAALEKKVASHAAILADVAPPATIVAFGGGDVPAGWLPCDGRELSTTAYPALYAVIGETFGGGAGTFNLPDLRGRAAIGAGAGGGLTERTVGQAIGGESHALTVNEMPSHDHGGGSHNHSAATGSGIGLDRGTAGWWGPNAQGSWSATGGSTSFSGGVIAAAGGNEPHSNMPPSLVVTYLIKL